jgi:hypothetical protein
MDQHNSIGNENIETEDEVSTSGKATMTSYREPLRSFLKKVVGFICYGPGVLGFLWLIGRILKR